MYVHKWNEYFSGMEKCIFFSMLGVKRKVYRWRIA
jgi:hypothetical protein